MDDKLQFLNGLTPEQALRYKLFSSASINVEAIRDMTERVVPPMLDEMTQDRVAFALAAAAKVFVVQLLETAKDVEEQALSSHAESGTGSTAGAAAHKPLEPGHIVEAARRLQLAHLVPGPGRKEGKAEGAGIVSVKAALPVTASGAPATAKRKSSKRRRVTIAQGADGEEGGSAAAAAPAATGGAATSSAAPSTTTSAAATQSSSGKQAAMEE